ncbi:MAG: hypothetical protein EA378_07420 [Phycisphaerales bacterium]|nr:MAG: hypothetical protein EA378_07420 [Phycisphaerales bacterium]
MMRVVSMAAAVAMVSGAAMAAPSTFGVGSDPELAGLLQNELFVAEGRTGNNAPSGDWELGITTNNPYTVRDQAQRSWTAGEFVAFSLTYDSSTGDVSYVFGDEVLSWNVVGNVGNIYLRARATEGEVMLRGLNLNGFDLSAVVGAGGDAGSLDILGISGAGSRFSLIGEAMIDPDGGRGSNPAFQIKVDTAPMPIIPTPTAAGLGLLGLGGLAARRRR